MQQRRGTATQWTDADPILAAGEIGFETDTGKFKVGDGTNNWSELSYFLTLDELGGNLDDYVPLTQRGAANGVATLDGAGKIPVAQLGNVIDGAGSALDTLNELAAALNDDANFSTTITNAISNRARVVAKTASQWAADTSETPAGQVSVETDTGKIKITTVAGATYAQTDYVVSLDELTSTITALNLSQISSDLNTAEGAITTLQGDLADIATNVSNNEQGVADLVTDLGAVTSRVSDLETFESSTTSALSDIDTDLALKAPKASPEFTGNVSLPSTTTIGTVSSTEIGYLDGVTSAIQTQIDGKAATSHTHSIENVTGLQTALDGKSGTTHTHSIADVANLQTSLDAKAPLANPTFTGTVAGVTKAHVGLGNVDNTSDASKPVSTATQTALDAKLNLSGGTLTGVLTLSGAPTSDLHAATKQYVDGLAAGINFHQPVVAATSGNLAGTYNNGTNGVGATLTRASNGSIGTIDGATVSVGNRILLRAQTDAKENGVYTVTAVGSVSAPWVITRAADADNNPSGELATGDFVFVTSGSTNGSKGFIVSTTGTITIGTTEITYAQFNASEAVIAGAGITKTGETISIGTGAITSAMILDGTIVDGDISTSAAIAQSKISGLSTSLDAKANVAAPTFTGLVTVASNGIAFTDGTQTMEGVPSRTVIIQRTSSNTLSGVERDDLIEMSSTSPTTLTIPTDATFNFPIGTSIDVLQTNTGQVTIAGAGGVTVNATPGLKLRTQWSSATLFKRAANTWVVYGDLTA